VTALFAEILAGGNELVVRVTGGSMAPILRDGDTVTLRRADASAVRPGDIVFYRRAAGPGVLHRVIRRRRLRDGRLLFQTMGDALCTPEQPFDQEALLGMAVAVRRATEAGGEQVIPLRAAAARVRGRITALLARAGFRRFRRFGAGLTPPGGSHPPA
jgi:signal peptidase I